MKRERCASFLSHCMVTCSAANPLWCKSKIGSSLEVVGNSDPREMAVSFVQSRQTKFGLQALPSKNITKTASPAVFVFI